MSARAESSSVVPRPSALRRGLDALLYSSGWLAGAAAAQTAVTFRLGPVPAAVSYPVVALVFAATLLVYNLDAVLPFKHGLPAGASGRRQAFPRQGSPASALPYRDQISAFS